MNFTIYATNSFSNFIGWYQKILFKNAAFRFIAIGIIRRTIMLVLGIVTANFIGMILGEANNSHMMMMRHNCMHQ